MIPIHSDQELFQITRRKIIDEIKELRGFVKDAQFTDERESYEMEIRQHVKILKKLNIEESVLKLQMEGERDEPSVLIQVCSV